MISRDEFVRYAFYRQRRRKEEKLYAVYIRDQRNQINYRKTNTNNNNPLHFPHEYIYQVPNSNTLTRRISKV